MIRTFRGGAGRGPGGGGARPATGRSSSPAGFTMSSSTTKFLT